ncbi:MAG: ATP synthase F1 subunit delta [Ignavibacteria bacterium]|nr:ATP synthase F1 subunit delta [Ignavibacteria bacterium]
MLYTKVTNRYAKAILDLSINENRLDEVNKDLEFVLNTISSIRELSLLLKSPIVKRDKKRKIIHNVFEGKVSDLTLRFCELVITRQRADLLPEIIKRFFELRDEYFNIKTVSVQSAVELEETHINQLINILEKQLNKKVRLSFKVEPKLIGGFIVQIDDTVIDASIKHQLELLRKKFLYGTEKLN